MQNRSKKNHLFLLLCFYAIPMYGMELVLEGNDCKKKPDKEFITSSPRRSHDCDGIIRIFKPQQAFKAGTPWRKVIPTKILMTPDSESLIIAEYGCVRHCLFDKKEDNSKIIIEHTQGKQYPPMIAVDQKKDGSMMVFSVNNYASDKNERLAECIIFCNGFSKKQSLDMPIQVIAAGGYGRLLAVAGQHDIKVIDVETDKSSQASFRFPHVDNNWIVDMAMHGEGKALIAAGNNGNIQWFSIGQDHNSVKIDHVKSIKVHHDIRNIYYPSNDELFYVACDGKIKSFSLDNILMTNNEDMKTNDFDQLTDEEWFFANHFVSAKVCCPKNVNLSKQASVTTIKVFRKNDKDQDEFFFEVPHLQDRYNYITDEGKFASAEGHLLYAIVGSKYVVALATDGELRVWKAPSKNIVNNNITGSKVELDSIGSLENIKPVSRSGSAKSKHSKLNSSDESDGEGKKSSPRDGKESGKKKLTDSLESLKQRVRSSSGSREFSPSRSSKHGDSKK